MPANTPNNLIGGPFRYMFNNGEGLIHMGCQGITDVSRCKMRLWFPSDTTKVCEANLDEVIGENNYSAAFDACNNLDFPPVGGMGGPAFLLAEMAIQIFGGNQPGDTSAHSEHSVLIIDAGRGLTDFFPFDQ